jgi:ATP-binding cassette, subfamily D (ALD), member 3
MELYKHILFVLNRRFWMGIYDSMLVKYGAFVVGYAILGLPVFGPKKEEYLASIGSDESKITKDYVRNTSLLINLAKAIGRIVVSYKDVQNLAGYTTLVYEMKEVLDDLDKGKYKRMMVKNMLGEGAEGAQPSKQQYMDNSLANKG